MVLIIVLLVQQRCSGLFAFKKAFKMFKVDMDYIRYMAVARNDEQTYLKITTRVPGSNSLYKQAINQLKVGDEMIMYSTAQHCTSYRSDKHLVFLSMGIGMVTFKNLFEAYEIDKTGINVDKHQTNLYNVNYESVVKYYCKNRLDYKTKVDEHITKSNVCFYLVGSDEFMKEQISYLKAADIDDHQIMIDRPNYHRVRIYGLKKI